LPENVYIMKTSKNGFVDECIGTMKGNIPLESDWQRQFDIIILYSIIYNMINTYYRTHSVNFKKVCIRFLHKYIC
jgi:hypothetical protein